MRNKESGSISWNLAPILVTWLDVWITFFFGNTRGCLLVHVAQRTKTSYIPSLY